MNVLDCSFCGKKFDSKEKCKKHEIFCKSKFENKIDKIFVKKGNSFLGGGIILFFLGLGMMFLFGKKGSFVKIFIFFGEILILVSFMIRLFCGEKIEFRCKNCGKRFVTKKRILDHLKKCKK